MYFAGECIKNIYIGTTEFCKIKDLIVRQPFALKESQKTRFNHKT